MPYSQFGSLQQVRQQLGITTTFRPLLTNLVPVAPSAWLLQTLEKFTQRRLAYFSEKSRSEALVFPILAELQERHQYRFSLYSGAIIEADKALGLNGECDFVLSRGEQSIEVERPICSIVEAKDNNLDVGIPQCIAQLVGARLFNEKEGLATPLLFGAVTTGTEWVFLKLEGSVVVIDTEFYSLKSLPELLGALDAVIRELAL